jgi:hypothetical protein
MAQMEARKLPFFFGVAFKEEEYNCITLQVSLDMVFLDRLEVRLCGREIR